MMNAQDYATQVEELFVLPDTVTRIKGLIDSDDATMGDIAEVIAFDPALCSQLLKVANSALFNFQSEIDSVTRAIQVIGTQSVYDFVMAFGVTQAFEKARDIAIDSDRFWEQSVGCALLCNAMATELKAGTPDRMFLCGILHNVGELAIAVLEPNTAALIEQHLANDDYIAVQKKHLGCSYAQISAAIANQWGLPESIVTPVSQFWRAPRGEDAMEVSILRASAQVMQKLTAGVSVSEAVNLAIKGNPTLNIEVDTMRSLLDFVSLETLNLLAIFNPGATTIR